MEKKRKSEGKKSVSIGQELWYGQFFEAEYICEKWMFELVDIVNTSIDANIPIASSVLDCPIRLYQYYSIIKQEMQAINAN